MLIDQGRLKELTRSFAGTRVGVVGDLIADVYLFGKPSRVSREAPVLVVRYEEEKVVPGSAANSAMNLAALGGKVNVVGAVGADQQGQGIIDYFAGAGMDKSGVIVRKDGETVAKTRILVSEEGRTPQQVIRLDREPTQELSPAEEKLILQQIEDIDPQVRGWLVSDYEYGLITPPIADLFLAIAKTGKTVIVDSRHNLGRYKGVDALCPNREEAEELLGRPLPDQEALLAGGREISRMLEPVVLFLTLGNQGMGVFPRGGDPVVLPVVGPDEVTDVSGAGDTVAATILLARCAGAAPIDAAWLATCAASMVVQKLGAATLDTKELRRAIKVAGKQHGIKPVDKEAGA